MERLPHFSGPNSSKGLDEFPDEPGGAQSRHGSPVDMHRVGRALWNGKWWLMGAALGGLMLAALVAKIMPPTYAAWTVLKFEGVPEIIGLPTPGHNVNQMGSLAEAVRTDDVLGRLREQLEIDEPLHIVARTVESIVDVPNGTVRVSVTDETAEGASRKANTLATIFLRHLEQRERGRIEQGLQNLISRLERAEGDLRSSRAEYDAFRQENGISDVETELGASITSAAALRAQRDMTEAEINALEARVAQLRRELRRTPRMQVASSANSTPEADELARLQTQLTTARSNLSADHPRVQSLERQIQALRLRLNSGQASRVSSATMGASGQYGQVESALSAAVADLESKRQELTDLRSLAGRDSDRVEQISGLEGQATNFLSRIAVEQSLVNDLRNIRTRMEDALRRPESGFSVVAPASVPTTPEPNKREKLAVLGVPLIVMVLAAIFLLFREFRGLRVCTASELAFWGRAPVIATTVWPRDLHAVDDLIADMDDYAPHAFGRTLVVGASREQSVLAHTVASRLTDDWNEPMSLGDYEPVGPSYAPASQPPPPPSSAAGVGMTPVYSSSPAGPYPDMVFSDSVALVAHNPRSTAFTLHRHSRRTVESWDGPDEGPALRRAARLADRVAIVVASGTFSVLDISAITTRIGRSDGVGYILVDVDPSLSRLKDRIGPVGDFWSTRRP